MDSIIKLNNLNFWYDRGKLSEMWALRNIDLEIERGDYVAFFGPSGSGKSTLLYLISGVEMAQEGQVLINDKNLSGLTKKELAVYRQVGVGMVFQQFNLIPSLTVLENVALPMYFLGINSGIRRAQAAKLLKRLDIENLGGRLPYELSGGQQQRVGIARALANNAPIIVADEPIGNLDSVSATKVLDFLKELNEKDGKTIIMVTHEAWSLRDAKKVFFIRDGKVEKVENMQEGNRAVTLSQNLYKELVPKHSEAEVAAYALSSLFFRGYSREETERFRSLLHQRLKNEIDADMFRILLDRPFKRGGGGLWHQKALKVSAYVEDMVCKRKELEQVSRELEETPELPLMEEIASLRRWLLVDYHGQVNEEQANRLDEVIGEVLRKVIDMDTFKKTLNLPKSKMGVGLSMRTSENVYEKLKIALETDDQSLWIKPEINQPISTPHGTD